MATIDWASTRDGFRFAMQSCGSGVTASLGDASRSTGVLLSEATVHSLARALNDAGYGCGVDVQQAVALDEQTGAKLQAQQQAALAAFNVAQSASGQAAAPSIPLHGVGAWPECAVTPSVHARGDVQESVRALQDVFVRGSDSAIGLRSGRDSRKSGFWHWLFRE